MPAAFFTHAFGTPHQAFLRGILGAKCRVAPRQLNDDDTLWRRQRLEPVEQTAIELGIPVLATSASLAYFDAYRCDRLPANLTQAQRDAFGSHTYQRSDAPDEGFVHTDWLP